MLRLLPIIESTHRNVRPLNLKRKANHYNNRGIFHICFTQLLVTYLRHLSGHGII
jgi:hypothetical protein